MALEEQAEDPFFQDLNRTAFLEPLELPRSPAEQPVTPSTSNPIRQTLHPVPSRKRSLVPRLSEPFSPAGLTSETGGGRDHRLKLWRKSLIPRITLTFSPDRKAGPEVSDGERKGAVPNAGHGTSVEEKKNSKRPDMPGRGVPGEDNNSSKVPNAGQGTSDEENKSKEPNEDESVPDEEKNNTVSNAGPGGKREERKKDKKVLLIPRHDAVVVKGGPLSDERQEKKRAVLCGESPLDTENSGTAADVAVAGAADGGRPGTNSASGGLALLVDVAAALEREKKKRSAEERQDKLRRRLRLKYQKRRNRLLEDYHKSVEEMEARLQEERLRIRARQVQDRREMNAGFDEDARVRYNRLTPGGRLDALSDRAFDGMHRWLMAGQAQLQTTVVEILEKEHIQEWHDFREAGHYELNLNKNKHETLLSEMLMEEIKMIRELGGGLQANVNDANEPAGHA